MGDKEIINIYRVGNLLSSSCAAIAVLVWSLVVLLLICVVFMVFICGTQDGEEE